MQELFVALSFSFAFAFALSCSFSKTFDGSFLGALVGAFLGAFLGAFGGEFSFAFVFARDVEWRAIGKLSFTFTLVNTWWGSNGVCKRREVVIILLGRLSGSATAFGGDARANPEGSCGGTRIARACLGWASWIRHGGHGQVDEKTVVGEAVGLLGSVE